METLRNYIVQPCQNRISPVYYPVWREQMFLFIEAHSLNSNSCTPKQLEFHHPPHSFLNIHNGPQTRESPLIHCFRMTSNILWFFRTPLKSRSSTCVRQVVKSVPRLHSPPKLVLLVWCVLHRPPVYDLGLIVHCSHPRRSVKISPRLLVHGRVYG